MKRGAFTLVELIVVITILAILWTIWFISLQWYSSEARDSKRISDINNLHKKIEVELSKWTWINELVTVTNTWNVTINSQSWTRNQGTVNFIKLKENRDDFTDNGIDYPVSYSIWWTGTWRYNFVQLATIKESTNQSALAWNYYKIQSWDSESLLPRSFIRSRYTTVDTEINIAPQASLTASWTSHWSIPAITNWVKRTDGTFDYEYHSGDTNAFINFNFSNSIEIWAIKIYNRIWCCSFRLSGAELKLYDNNDNIIYTYILPDTSSMSEIYINFVELWEVHMVKRINLKNVNNEVINIREIEIFPVK